MSDDDKQGLYQLVRGWLVSDSHGRKRVEQAIFDAHNGRPDGYLVNMGWDGIVIGSPSLPWAN